MARWADDTVLVRMGDGSTLELPVPRELRAQIEVGVEVRVDGSGRRLLRVVAPTAP